MIKTLALASVSFAFAACASSAPVAISSPTVAPLQLSVDEEGDEWESDCKQELGRDSGEAQRAHLVTAGEWINGCFVNGDDLDAFVLDVPASAPWTFQIEFIHRGGAALQAALLAADGRALTSEGLVLEGAHLSRSLVIEPGQRIQLRIAKAAGKASAWYRFKATADLASK